MSTVTRTKRTREEEEQERESAAKIPREERTKKPKDDYPGNDREEENKQVKEQKDEEMDNDEDTERESLRLVLVLEPDGFSTWEIICATYDLDKADTVEEEWLEKTDPDSVFGNISILCTLPCDLPIGTNLLVFVLIYDETDRCMVLDVQPESDFEDPKKLLAKIKGFIDPYWNEFFSGTNPRRQCTCK